MNWRWLIVAALLAAPVWWTDYLPSQDAPQHVAILRVIHSIGDPTFGLSDYEREPFGPYGLHYLLGEVLARVVGVWSAHRLLISAYFAGSFLAIVAMLRQVRRDEHASLLLVPLLYNAALVVGFLPFLTGVVFALWSVSAALEHDAKPTLSHGAMTALLLVATVLAHPGASVVALIGCSAVVVASVKAKRFGILPMVPPLIILFVWSRTATAELVNVRLNVDIHVMSARLRELNQWTTGVYRDGSGTVIGVATLLVAVTAGTLTFAERRQFPGIGVERRRQLALAVLPATCMVVYAFATDETSFFSALAKRFGCVATMTAVLLVAVPRAPRARRALQAVFWAIAGIAWANSVVKFVQFDAEARGFTAVVDHLEPRLHVRGLAFYSSSRIVRFDPYLHFVAYYQAAKGGVVQYSFAGYPHMPYDFRDGRYPPPGGPAPAGAEWMPETARAADLAPYFDAVVARGPGFDPADVYEKSFQSGEWIVFRLRRDPSH